MADGDRVSGDAVDHGMGHEREVVSGATGRGRDDQPDQFFLKLTGDSRLRDTPDALLI